MIPLLYIFLLLPLAYLVVPVLVRVAGRAVGWHLRRLSRQRRLHLLDRVAKEREAYASKLQQSSAAEDEDWEKVDSGSAGVAPNGGKASREWKGIIGFFHPFWYDFALGCKRRMLLIWRL